MDVKRTVEILFQGTDQTSKTVREIGKSFDTLGGTVTSIAQPFSKLADGVLVADAALAALAIGGMALAISKASEFETSFAEISTLIDDTGENVGQFKEQILDYARDSTKSLGDINAAVYTAISAGVDYADTLGVLNDAEKLAVAGKGDLESSIRLVASTLNAYGDSTDEATRYSNAFFNAVKLGQTTLPELAAGLSKVTGIAASAGIPIEDLTGAVAALTAAGQPTTEAMTGLKAAIGAILAPGGEAITLFDKLGIEYGKSALEARGFDGVLQEIYEKTGGNHEQIRKLVGGMEGMNSALILAEDKTGKYAAALEQMRSGQDVVTEAFRLMAEAVSVLNQRLETNWDLLLIRIGDNLLEAYSGVASGVIDIFKGMQDAITEGHFDELFEAIKQWAWSVEDFLETVAKNIPAAFALVNFDDLIDALQSLGDEFGFLFEGIDLSTPEGLADAIQAAVNTITSLVRITEGMASQFKPIFQAIRQGVSDFNALGEGAQQDFGKVLAAAKLVTEAGVVVAAAIVMIAESGTSIEDVFDAVVGTIKLVWNTLQVAFDSIVLKLANFLDHFLKIADMATSLVPGLGKLNEKIEGAREAIEGFVAAVKENQAQNMGEGIDGAAQAFDGFTGKATEAKEAAKAAGETIEKAFPGDLEVKVAIDPAGNIEAAGAAIEGAIPKETTTKVLAEVDDGSIANAKAEIDNAIPDEKTSLIKVEMDDGSLLLTNKKLVDGLPAEQTTFQQVEMDDGSLLLTNRTLDEVSRERTVPIKATVDKEALKKSEEYLIEEMKKQADLLETTIEWTAKVNVAAIQAEAEKVKAAFESTSATISATGEVMQTIFQEWTGLDFQGRWEARKALEVELELQKQAADLQAKMIEEQIKLSELKRERLKGGEGLIKIDSSGLEPSLEMILWQILEKVQIRATEQEADFLLGI